MPLFPSTIRHIAVAAPAHMITPEQMEQGLALLHSEGLTVSVCPHAVPTPLHPNNTCADLQQRAAELQEAWLNPEHDAILCVRGGDGAQHVLPLLDWDKLRTRPDLPVIGFSNISALLSACLTQHAGHPFSGTALRGLPQLDADETEHYRRTLAGEPLADFQLTPVIPGPCQGTVFGGHILVLSGIADTPYLPDNHGKIVFLEHSQHPTPEQVLQHIQKLDSHHFFDGIAGLVLCQLSHPTQEARQLTATLITEALKHHDCPVFSGYPYGHEHPMKMLDLRRHATITAAGLLSFNH